MGERVQKGMEGSIWKGVVWGNKWLGNASVGLSFKALFALEKMGYICHGGFWRDILFSFFCISFHLTLQFFFLAFGGSSD